MPGVFGKEVLPSNTAAAGRGGGLGAVAQIPWCKPSRYPGASRTGGKVAGSEAPPDGSGDGDAAERGCCLDPGPGARLGRTLLRQVRERQ